MNYARLKFTFIFLTVILLIAAIRVAHSSPIPAKFKPGAVPVLLFCESITPFREMMEAYEAGGEELATEVAMINIKGRQCHALPNPIPFIPIEVVERFPEDYGIVVSGTVEHLTRGVITVFIVISEAQLEMITSDIKI